MKKRADILLAERGMARSRSEAADLIRRGLVTIEGKLIAKPGENVRPEGDISVTAIKRFVGRGGEKLDYALDHFCIDARGALAADFGSSTGGFTECLLMRGAKRVYAIDVGTGQLAAELRENPNVVSLEGTDARTVAMPEKVDLVVIDVSFIPLAKVLPAAVAAIKEDGAIIALVKPQFEVGKGKIGKKGIVRNESDRLTAVLDVATGATLLGLTALGIIESPIAGGSGNIEYLACFRKSGHREATPLRQEPRAR